MFPLLHPCLYRLLLLLPLLLPLPLLARLRAWGCTRRRLRRLDLQHLHQHHCHWNRRCQLSMTVGS